MLSLKKMAYALCNNMRHLSSSVKKVETRHFHKLPNSSCDKSVCAISKSTAKGIRNDKTMSEGVKTTEELVLSVHTLKYLHTQNRNRHHSKLFRKYVNSPIQLRVLLNLQLLCSQSSCDSRQVFNRKRTYLNLISSFRHFSRHASKNYYDVLGVTPKANQTQIKSAYYKLSKLHHPDIKKDDEEHKMFLDITEAYEVLGNIRKRRLYDRGIISPRHQTEEKEEDHESSSFTEREGFVKKPGQPVMGRSSIYNFDEFYRQHYQIIQKRKKRDKLFDEKQILDDELQREQVMRGRIITSLGIVIVGLLFLENYRKKRND